MEEKLDKEQTRRWTRRILWWARRTLWWARRTLRWTRWGKLDKEVVGEMDRGRQGDTWVTRRH